MQLTDIQHCFTAYALRGEEAELVAAYVRDNGLSAGQRLSVYRNNTQMGLTGALRDGYPVIDKLIGTDCFNQFALEYIRQHPPAAGCLLVFGQSLAKFLEAYPPLASLPYLADVARLEWFWHEAFHEADGKAMSIQDLVRIKPEQYPDLSLQLQPSARLLTSAYPVLAVWQTNQDDYEGYGQIDLNQGGSRVLIFRPFLEVLMCPLAPAEFRFLSALQQGLPMNKAVTDAFQTDDSFDVLDALQRWFARGLFTRNNI